MKQLKLFFALFAMLALGVGNAWGAETLYKNALFKIANCTKNSSYTGKVTCTIGADSWVAQNAANNNGQWDYVKIGAKKSKSSDPTKVTTGTITTDAAYAEAVSKIVVNGKKDRGSFTSKLIIASNSSFTTDKVEITGATSFTNNQIVFTIPSPSANKYYKLEFVCSNTTTSNGVIQVSSVEYYYEPSSEETVVSMPTFSVPECTFYSSSLDVELSCATDGATIHYTIDGTTPSETSPTYSGAIAINKTTTIKAIAVKDGLTDSEVATATYTKGETVTSYDIDFETNALEAYVNWDFSNITIAKTITAKGGTYYGNTSGKASASIKTKEQIQYPGTLTFSVSKESNNTTASNWLVQVSENGTTWSTVGTISATEMTKGNWNVHSVDLSDYENVYVQISYGSSTAIRAIDDISLAQGVAPVKYTLTIENPENGTLSVTKGGASVASGDQFKAGTSLVVTPTPNAGYVFESLTVDGTEVELSEGKYTFTMPENDVIISATFKANEKPDATLILSKNGETELLPGNHKQDDVVTLPDFESDCSKTFVGWSENENCATKPEYAPGAEFTLTKTEHLLYAVYADESLSGNKVEEYSFSYFDQADEIILDSPEAFDITLLKGSASTAPQWNSSKSEARIYAKGSMVITATLPISKVVYTYNVNENSKGVTPTIDGVTGKVNNGSWDAETKTWTGNDTEVTFSTSGTAGNVGFSKVEVTVGAIVYSNYSTTCAAALEKPTFSVVEGTYTEAKSIELSATEGDIYYTLDGTEPTESSTPYTAAIDLDECGTTTIKAIAISTESQSPVASATYTINLPITNTAATAYTPAEAIAIIDGECDKTEEVFVKGVVVSTSEFNATYGNYDVIVKAVDDNSATPTTFTFYRMYKAASNTKFTESDEVIGVGDIITAKGKLTKYNSTYELADGCYMVERVAYTEPKTDISNTLETAYTVDKAFELISDIKSDLDKEVYVKGLVAVASTELYEEKYLTYSISDNGQNSGNVLKVYDGLDINGVAFTSKDDVKVGDYVVVKGKLLNYKGTYEINKDNQLVQHVKAATITIADFTMEVGETKTIAATITPAEAAVTYAIKENAANAISLSGNTITALVEGTATITATVADGATYLGNSVDFTVTVGPKAESEEVVILAEYNGNWYALKAATGSGSNSLAALEVTYFNGILYNVTEADKASITWTRTIVGNQVTFKNGENYLTGGTGTGLSLANASFEWTYKIEDGQDTYIYEYEDKGSIKSRTFLFYKDGYFKNYATSNAKPTQTEYSGYPVVTTPDYDTAIEIGSGDNTTVIEANKNQKVNVIVDRAFEAGDEWYTLCVPFNMQASLIGTAYQLSGIVKKGADFVEVNLAPKNTIEAGQPYLIKPSVSVSKFVVENVTIVNATGESIAKSIEGLSVEMQGVINGDGTTNGLYWVGNNGYLYNDSASKLGLRTYFNIKTPSGIAPRMRVVAGENVETGVEDLFKTDAPVKVIENGQLIIIRDGVKYNVQGQKL